MNHAPTMNGSNFWAAEDIESLAMSSASGTFVLRDEAIPAVNCDRGALPSFQNQPARPAPHETDSGRVIHLLPLLAATHPKHCSAVKLLDAILSLDSTAKRPLRMFARALAYHFGVLYTEIRGHLAQFSKALPPDAPGRRHLDRVDRSLQEAVRMLRLLLDISASGVAAQTHVHTQSTLAARLFPSSVCQSWKASRYRGMDGGMGGPVTLLAHSMAIQLQAGLVQIHRGIASAFQGFEPTDGARRRIKRFHRDIRAAMYVCDHLADYGGCKKRCPEPVRMDRMISDCLDHYRLGFNARRLQVDCHEAHPYVLGDRSQLQKLFMELFSCGDGSPSPLYRIQKIAIHQQRPPHPNGKNPFSKAALVVDLKLEGQISGSELLAYFHYPFFSASGRREDQRLGLAAAFGIVSRHGGKIRVLTAPDGFGLRILLPKLTAPSKHAPKPVPSLGPQETEPAGPKASGSHKDIRND